LGFPIWIVLAALKTLHFLLIYLIRRFYQELNFLETTIFQIDARWINSTVDLHISRKHLNCGHTHSAGFYLDSCSCEKTARHKQIISECRSRKLPEPETPLITVSLP